jgi:hypothetical protein
MIGACSQDDLEAGQNCLMSFLLVFTYEDNWILKWIEVEWFWFHGVMVTFQKSFFGVPSSSLGETVLI